jgi:hypothetical protein
MLKLAFMQKFVGSWGNIPELTESSLLAFKVTCFQERRRFAANKISITASEGAITIFCRRQKEIMDGTGPGACP